MMSWLRTGQSEVYTESLPDFGISLGQSRKHRALHADVYTGIRIG